MAIESGSLCPGRFGWDRAAGMEPVDLLAIGAHPDDVEVVCGGTLLRAADQGRRTAVIDLTRGEMGTRGTPEIRAAESARAAEVLGLCARRNAELPDTRVFDDEPARQRLVALLRELRPRVVILQAEGVRHPDHRAAAALGKSACFLAGLKNYGAGAPHRPEKILTALAYQEAAVKPSFIVDTSEQFERKLEAVACYASQELERALSAGELFANGQPYFELLRTQDRHYGSRIRCAYGEPFLTSETLRVDDVVALDVRSM